MSSTFEDPKITALQPKQEKDAERKEVLTKLVFKGESRLNNSLQITDLFAGVRKRLVKVKFSPYDQYENDITFNHVSIEDFTVKNRMEKVGQGKDVERIPVEHVFFNHDCENGGGRKFFEGSVFHLSAHSQDGD